MLAVLQEFLKESRPKILPFEFEVTLAKANQGLHMNIGNINGHVVVLGFRPTQEGTLGKAQLSGKIRPGDMLVAVNGHYINKLSFKALTGLLSKLTHPFVYLRFLRTAPHDR